MRIRIILLFILLFYIWISGPDTFNFTLDHGGSGDYISYNHLTESFLAGKLHLLKEPDPRLLALPDPYDPASNARYKWHDATLYDGKYYLYFGPVPVIILYLPFKLLTKLTMTDTLACTIFMFGSVIWGALLLVHIRKIYYSKIPRWVLLTCIAALGFANIGPMIVMRHCGLYHVAISSAIFFLAGAIYWLTRAISTSPYPVRYFLLASLFLGLGAGSRPQIPLTGTILLFVAWAITTKCDKPENMKIRAKQGLALATPFLTCLLLLGLYNYLRFGNPFEVGTIYQVGDMNWTMNYPFSTRNIPANLYFNLFHLPRFNGIFPFFHVYGTIAHFIQRPAGHYFQHIVGILPGIPFVLIPAIGWILIKLNQNENTNSNLSFPKFEVLFLAIPCLVNIGVLLIYICCALRFHADFALLLILIASVFWFYFYLRFNQDLKKSLNTFAITTATLSIIMGMAFGIEKIEPHRRSLREVQTFFMPLSNFIFRNITQDWESVEYFVKKIPVILKSDTSSFGPFIDPRATTDRNFYSHWVSRSNETPSLTFEPIEPATIKSIWLLARRTSFYESWKKIEAKFYLYDVLSSEQAFYFPNAHKTWVQHADVKPVKANRIVLTFSDPNTTTIEGKEVDPRLISPGYTEIMFEKSE